MGKRWGRTGEASNDGKSCRFHCGEWFIYLYYVLTKKEDDCFTNPRIRVSDEVHAHITAYFDPDYQTLTKIAYHVKGHSVFIKVYGYR